MNSRRNGNKGVDKMGQKTVDKMGCYRAISPSATMFSKVVGFICVKISLHVRKGFRNPVVVVRHNIY